MFGQGIDIYKKRGLQYRLCIFMGDYGQQTIELIGYERSGDVEEEDTESDDDSDDNIAAADVSEFWQCLNCELWNASNRQICQACFRQFV